MERVKSLNIFIMLHIKPQISKHTVFHNPQKHLSITHKNAKVFFKPKYVHGNLSLDPISAYGFVLHMRK